MIHIHPVLFQLFFENLSVLFHLAESSHRLFCGNRECSVNGTEISWARKLPENLKTVKFPKYEPFKCEPFWEENKRNESPREEKFDIPRAPSFTGNF